MSGIFNMKQLNAAMQQNTAATDRFFKKALTEAKELQKHRFILTVYFRIPNIHTKQ